MPSEQGPRLVGVEPSAQVSGRLPSEQAGFEPSPHFGGPLPCLVGVGPSAQAGRLPSEHVGLLPSSHFGRFPPLPPPLWAEHTRMRQARKRSFILGGICWLSDFYLMVAAFISWTLCTHCVLSSVDVWFICNPGLPQICRI